MINMYPISQGGGLQNALSFLSFLANDGSRRQGCIVVARKGSRIEQICLDNGIEVESISDGFFRRLVFELALAKKISIKHSIKKIFTLFGNTPFSCRHISSVSGFAYSNIIEADNEFWSFLPQPRRSAKKVMDIFRKLMTKWSDIVIVETPRLLALARKNNIFQKTTVVVVKMAPSQYIHDKLTTLDDVVLSKTNTYRITYIAGPHPNKRIEQLAVIFYHLNKTKKTIAFNLTVTLPQCGYLNTISQEFSRLGIQDRLSNAGPIDPASLHETINSSHAIINISRLESFSNNWVEAWASRRLLICPNAEYARDSCGNAALYIDLDEPAKSANLIYSVFTSQKQYDVFVEEGKKNLSLLPSPHQRYVDYWKVISTLQ